MDSATISSYLFKTAAVLNGVAVPGHIVFGFQQLYPTVKTLKPSQAAGAATAKVGFEHMTIGIATAAILNWRWSTTGGPQGTDEKAIFWAFLAGGWLIGRRYFKVGEYGPLFACLWLPPLCSLIAWSLVW